MTRMIDRATDERALAWLALSRDGLSCRDISRRFGVSSALVHQHISAVQKADLAESGEPVRRVASHYSSNRRGFQRGRA